MNSRPGAYEIPSIFLALHFERKRKERLGLLAEFFQRPPARVTPSDEEAA